MTALILMLAWLPHVLPAMSELPQPVNVFLNSRHFSHVLKWEPGPGTPPGVYYRVTVQTQAGASRVPVVGCEHVQHPLVCNLTEAFSDPREVYFTRITALLEAQESQPVKSERFKPIRDTDLDLPLLTVASCGVDLCVDMEPPVEHLREIYDSLHYTLRFKSDNADKAQFFRYTTSLRREILKDPVYGRQYCVSVRFSGNGRESNYSRPVCSDRPSLYTAEPWISAIMCLLVIPGVVVGVLMVYTGFTCLTKSPLPSVLTSIHHIEEALAVPSRSTSLSSLLNLKPTPPSSGEKGFDQTSDESDGEIVTEITGGSRGGGGGNYKLRKGTNLLSSSSSSSSSSLSAPLAPEPESPSFSSNQNTSDVFSLQPSELSTLTETHSDAGPTGPLSTHSASRSDSLRISNRHSDPRPEDTDGLTVGRNQPKEEEEEKLMGEEDTQDVDLLTLTFSRLGEEDEEDEEEEEKEEEPESSSVSEVYNTFPTLPSLTRDTKEVAIESVSCSVDEEEEQEEEEEEEEHCGYMGRL